MVKLLDEFPGLHQTFNLVPSLITQLQEYVNGTAQDPFLQVAAMPAAEMDLAERQFAVQYLFQANAENMIGRYPRYRELSQHFHGRPQDAHNNAQRMTDGDITDLQVLSQIAWMDEFFLDDPRRQRADQQRSRVFTQRPAAGDRDSAEFSGQGPSGLCRGGEARRD